MTKAVALGCMTFLLCHSLSHQEDKGKARRFIVGFELSAEKGLSLVWPLPAMPPSGYKSILMVVETMPRIYRQGGQSEPCDYLSAHRHLSVNGRTLPAGKKPPSAVPSDPQEFLLELQDGRLRLTLTIPSGWGIDPQHNAAVIKLFEVPNAVLRPYIPSIWMSRECHRRRVSEERSICSPEECGPMAAFLSRVRAARQPRHILFTAGSGMDGRSHEIEC